MLQAEDDHPPWFLITYLHTNERIPIVDRYLYHLMSQKEKKCQSVQDDDSGKV